LSVLLGGDHDFNKQEKVVDAKFRHMLSLFYEIL